MKELDTGIFYYYHEKNGKGASYEEIFKQIRTFSLWRFSFLSNKRVSARWLISFLGISIVVSMGDVFWEACLST